MATLEQGECGCLTWSVGDKNMLIIIPLGQEKDKEQQWRYQHLSEKLRDFQFKALGVAAQKKV